MTENSRKELEEGVGGQFNVLSGNGLEFVPFKKKQRLRKAMSDVCSILILNYGTFQFTKNVS